MERCEPYWNLISAGLDGDLTPEERTRLEEHLAQCPDCRALWEQLQGLEPELEALESPSPGFTGRVMAAVERTQQDIPFTDLPQDRAPGRQARKQLDAWWKPVRALVLAAACCLILLGLGRFSAQFFGSGSSAPNSTGAPADAQGSVAADQAESQESAAAVEADGSSQSSGTEDAAEAVLRLEDGDYRPAGAEDALPRGFTRAGTLTEAQAGDTGLAGRDYYTDPAQPGVCYVAQGDGSYLRWELAGD